TFFPTCNLFFSSPHGRENLDDEAAQITAFTAVPSSDNSVVTMWNWKEPPSWVYDDKITEIQIQHSIFGYPENYIFFANESISDKTQWQEEWTDLIPGITHYFSLFAMVDDGDGGEIWLAPIKAKAKLPGTSEPSVNYSRSDSVNADNTMAEWLADPDISLEITSSKWAVVFFDFPDGIFVDSAKIYLSDGGTSATEVTFVPLTGFFPSDDMQIWYELDIGSIVNYSNSITFSTIDPFYDITSVVRAAATNPIKAILIKTNDPASTLTYDNNASAPYIIADIIK
nr:hypothetical protein [Spirochaetia bacterium]